MPNLNKVMLIGNITKDPEIRYTPAGDPVLNINLAINRTWKNKSGERQKSVEFISVVIWNKTADVVAQYCKKGDPLFVEGRIQTRSWEKDGVKHYKTEVFAEGIQLMGSKREKPAEKDEEFNPDVDENVEFPEAG